MPTCYADVVADSLAGQRLCAGELGVDEHGLDRGLQVSVRVADDHLDAVQPTGLQAARDRGPKSAVLAVADVEAEYFQPPAAATPVATTTAWETTRWSTLALQFSPAGSGGAVKALVGSLFRKSPLTVSRAPPAGIEPATYRLEGGSSIR
jgi:hypothetical protein